MANTPNYNLKKVEYTEIADIPGHFNANFDTIDTAMKNNADAAVAAEDNAKSYASGLIGALSNLLTTAKNNIVAAVNEIFGKVEDVEADLAAHKADGVHQKVEVTSTDDATSVTNAPLKSAGGLAVAKSAYIGGKAKIQATYLYSNLISTRGDTLLEKEYIVPNTAALRVFVSRAVNTSVAEAQGFIEAVVLKGSSTNFVITEISSKNKEQAYGNLEITNNGEKLVVRKTSGSGGTAFVYIRIESNQAIEEV